MRRVLEPLEREPVRVGAEPVAIGAAAQHDVQRPLGPDALAHRGDQLGRVAAGHRRDRRRGLAARQLERDHSVERVDVGIRALPGGDPGQPQERHPLRLLAVRELDAARGE